MMTDTLYCYWLKGMLKNKISVMLSCASEPEHQKETKPSLFSFIELKIEEMEEVIEDLESEVEEHDGIIGKGYFFQV